MGLLDKLNPFSKKSYEATINPPNNIDSITTMFVNEQEYRYKQTLKSWTDAVDQADFKTMPNRRALIKLYKDIMLDGHLQALINLRKERVMGSTFEVVDNNSNIIPVLTNQFKEEWFYNFMKYTLEATYYGHSLIQIDWDDNMQPIITYIPREMLIPEFKQYKKNIYDVTGTSYDNKKYYPYLIDIYANDDPKDLGLLNSVCPIALMKKETKLSWAQYNEIFGQPLRVATTPSENPIELQRLNNMLKNLGRSGYITKNENTKIDFIEASGTDTTLYQNFEEISNKEMSKLIVGGTEIIDDGSSYSQSKTHNSQFDLKVKSDMRNLEFIINGKLIPKLQALELLPKGVYKFRFDSYETLSLVEQFGIDSQLMLNPNYVIPAEYFRTKYRVDISDNTAKPIPVEVKSIPSEQPIQ